MIKSHLQTRVTRSLKTHFEKASGKSVPRKKLSTIEKQIELNLFGFEQVDNLPVTTITVTTKRPSQN